MNEEVVYLSVFQISPDPDQPRKQFLDEELADLADSIKVNGVISPIIVSPIGNDRYRIVAGERRWRASIKAKQNTIPAIIRDLAPFKRKVQALLENIQRSDLNAMEEARAYQNLQIEFQLSHEEIANVVGKSRSSVSNALRLLNLPSFVQDMIIDGNISPGHAKLLMSLHKEEDIIYIAGKVVQKQLSVKETKQLVDQQLKSVGSQLQKGMNENSINLRTLHRTRIEEHLTRLLATSVHLRWKEDGNGSITIDFHDSEDFERLMDLLNLELPL